MQLVVKTFLILILLSLVLDPLLHVDLTFLRILRAVRLGQSEYLLQDLELFGQDDDDGRDDPRRR